jgi:hypothetical protein
MHKSKQQQRDHQAAWVIITTLAVGSVVSQLTRSAPVALAFVALALVEWRIAVFRDRVETWWANRHQPAAHPGMGS